MGKSTKSSANAKTLGERMKRYESVTTGRVLIPRLPLYARIDGRSFHTFTRGLDRPFDSEFVKLMQDTCSHMVAETNANIGYAQSDEISLGWESVEKAPFETRLFKLESVFAAMATAVFVTFGMGTKLKDRILKFMPHFDCRVCQTPNLDELGNMFVWRELDCIKNSINAVALSVFPHSKLQRVDRRSKLEMLLNEGVDYEKDFPDYLRSGSYFRREPYEKELTAAEIAKIPESKRTFDENGKMKATRSRTVRFGFNHRLSETANLADALFFGAEPVPKSGKE